MGEDIIIYAWKKIRWETIREGNLPSSMDTWGEECGWDRDDYNAAARSKATPYTIIGINYIIKQGEDEYRWETEEKKFAIRVNEANFKKSNFVIFHKSDNQLLDIGGYGIYGTLTGEKIYDSDYLKHILKYDGQNVYFTKERIIRYDEPILAINLEELVAQNHLNVRAISQEERDSLDTNGGLWETLTTYTLLPIRFEVDGETHQIQEYMNSDFDKEILDHNRKTVVDRKQIINAIGFPKKNLCNRLYNYFF